MRRARLMVASVIAFALTTVGGQAGPVGAREHESAHGYWWRLQGSDAQLPPPAFVPDDGLWVARDPGGDHAVSALRVTVQDGLRPVTLTLDAADARGTPEVIACATSGEWSAAEAGPWSQRPAAGCSDGPAATGGDGRTWSWDISGIAVAGGALDVALVPKPGGTNPFSLSFDPPAAGAVAFASSADSRPTPSQEPAKSGVGSAAPSHRPGPDAPYVPPGPGGAPSALFGDDGLIALPPLEVGVPGESVEPGRGQSRRAASRGGEGPAGRSPFVLMAVLAVIAAWVIRSRFALQAATDHPLASPGVFVANSSALRGAALQVSASGDE